MAEELRRESNVRMKAKTGARGFFPKKMLNLHFLRDFKPRKGSINFI